MKKIVKPTFDRKRPLSWSALSAFMWSKQGWYDKYVLGLKPEITPELEFGSYVDKRIQSDKKFLPKLERYPIMQHEMRATFNGIPLIGIADHFDRTKKRLKDDKTGRKKWDRKRADDTGQLTLYCLLLWLTEKIRPEDMHLQIDWLPTHIKDGKICFIEPNHKKLAPTCFTTKRTMKDVVDFGQFILTTYKDMADFCESYTPRPVHVPVDKPLHAGLK